MRDGNTASSRCISSHLISCPCRAFQHSTARVRSSRTDGRVSGQDSTGRDGTAQDAADGRKCAPQEEDTDARVHCEYTLFSSLLYSRRTHQFGAVQCTVNGYVHSPLNSTQVDSTQVDSICIHVRCPPLECEPTGLDWTGLDATRRDFYARAYSRSYANRNAAHTHAGSILNVIMPTRGLPSPPPPVTSRAVVNAQAVAKRVGEG